MIGVMCYCDPDLKERDRETENLFSYGLDRKN